MASSATDIGGNPLPPDQNAAGGLEQVLAVPPVREFPNEQATEFLWTAYLNLPAAGVAFLPMLDPTTGAAFSQLIQPVYRARVDALLYWCPDMVAATAPYLFSQMQIKGQLANAWGFVPIYPRSGIASLSYEPTIDLGPSSRVELFAKNTDPANTHLLVVEMHGWYWPKAMVQA